MGRVSPTKDPPPALVPTISEPVKEAEKFKPVHYLLTPKGEQVIDFGQNLAGWVACKISGKAGDTIRISHAEMLDKEGNFFTQNLRAAKATDIYILKGAKKEYLKPHFTWHGFRYVKVEGCSAQQNDFTAIALYSALSKTGNFTCSNPALNQLQHNIEWSLKSNLLDIPTDCPQRSERLGWTGDAHIICRTAGFNFNIKLFFTKWLQDLKADQLPNGSVPGVIPDMYRKTGRNNGIAGWSDAAVIIPWTLYQLYADTAILREQYPSMRNWVNYIESRSKNDLWIDNGYGDWLAPGDSTSLPLIDQCFWAYSTQLLIQTAQVLGNTADVEKYNQMLKQVKTAFLQHYINADGKMLTPTQTAYVLALHFDMLPDSFKTRAAERLSELVWLNNNHLSTGFLGTPYLLHALSNNGYTDVAFNLLNQDSCPSWLYPVKMGATTIWEKWDAIRPDSTVQATSFNHYAYGAVGDWLYQVVAGINMAAPGYKKIIINPHPGGGLTWVNASYECLYGKIVSNWKLKNGKCKMQVEIPPGTTATIYIPGKTSIEVKAGKYKFEGNY